MVGGEGVEETRGTAAVRRARAEVGHELGQPVEVEQAVLVVVPRDEPDRARVVQRLEVAAEDRVGPAGRDVQHDDVVVGAALGAEHAESVEGNRLRSMPMTGVMPDPAVTKSSLPPPSWGSTNSPWACSRWTSVPGWQSCTRWWLTRPSGTALTVIEISPSGRGPWVSEYARHWRTPSTSMPIRRYWPGTWPAQSAPGLDQQGGGVLGLGVDRDDPAAELGAAAQRREEVEEVGGHEGAAGGSRHTAQLGAQGAPGGRRSGGGGHVPPGCPIDVTNS